MSLSTVVAVLAGLQPVSVCVGAVLGYLFGGKVLAYAQSAVATVYADIKAKL